MNCLTDWNCRLLPPADPLLGDDAEIARALLYSVEQFGIKRFCMMPTYDAGAESVARFLLRRDRLEEHLLRILPAGARLRMGASVLLQPRLHELADLRRLSLRAASHALPVELPIGAWEDWMDLEINRLLYRAKQKLLFLHAERYPILYPEEVLARLARIPDAVYQFNYRALTDPRCLQIIRSLLARGATVLLGTALEDPQKISYFELPYYLEAGEAALSRAEIASLLQGAHLYWNA